MGGGMRQLDLGIEEIIEVEEKECHHPKPVFGCKWCKGRRVGRWLCPKCGWPNPGRKQTCGRPVQKHGYMELACGQRRNGSET